MEIRLKNGGLNCFLAALMCLVVPMEWIFAALTAAFVHELCHVFAVFVMKGRIYGFSIGTGGAVIDASILEPWQDLLCILAGPAGSLSLLAVAEYVPKTALCGFVHGMYNLLPVYPLDGGRALRCLTGMLCSSNKADRILRITEWIVYFLIMTAGVYGTFAAKLGMMPILTAVLFLSRTIQGKFPCKEGKLAVQ